MHDMYMIHLTHSTPFIIKFKLDLRFKNIQAFPVPYFEMYTRWDKREKEKEKHVILKLVAGKAF